jgi:uncharacterized spore protein YtfJ
MDMDANEIVAAITDRVRDAANVNVVFGDIIEGPGGVSIIPVASVKVSGGGGGGGGNKRKRDAAEEGAANEGTGLGLGVSVTAKPIGYIEVKGEGARFIPTPDVTKMVVSGTIAFGMLLLTAMKLMRFKAFKQKMTGQRTYA